MTSKQSNPKDICGTAKAPLSTVSAPVIAELGVAMLEGACKYGRHNYRAVGIRASVYYDATMRHLMAWWEGEDLDPDSGLSHVTKAIASLVVLRDAMINAKVDDDRPPSCAPFYVDLNAKAADIIARYADRNPRHYTIVDTLLSKAGLGDSQEMLTFGAYGKTAQTVSFGETKMVFDFGNAAAEMAAWRDEQLREPEEATTLVGKPPCRHGIEHFHPDGTVVCAHCNATRPMTEPWSDAELAAQFACPHTNTKPIREDDHLMECLDCGAQQKHLQWKIIASGPAEPSLKTAEEQSRCSHPRNSIVKGSIMLQCYDCGKLHEGNDATD